MTTKIRFNSIEEAVEVFVASGFDAEGMRNLMVLIESQTDYVQKRFWKLVDAQR
jgi:hypothetical protein